MNMRLVTGVVLVGFMVAAPTLAQQNDSARRLIDQSVSRFEELVRRADNVEVKDPGPAGETLIIDFEAVRSRDGRTPALLTNHYEKSHGVRFGRGVSVHRCSSVYDELSTSLCPYPRAASGERAAMFDIEAGGSAMVVDLIEPAISVSVRINPTGGGDGAQYVAQAVGLDAQGDAVAAARENVAFDPNNPGWPNMLSLKGERPILRVQIVMSRQGSSVAAARVASQPVRFFIDDFAVTRAASSAVAPVAALLAAQDGPPKVGRAQVVQSPRVGAAQSTLRVYPAAVRKRLAIDWDAVDAVLADEDALGLNAAAPTGAGQKYVDLAELPALLPQEADAGSLQVFGNADSVNAVWRSGGRDYSVYGSRLATVINKADGASGVRSAVSFSGSDDDYTASFSLFGAAYSVTQHCIDGGDEDPACYDSDALGKLAESLVVVVGEAGRGRP